jgi:hypothetical protein
MLPSSNIAVPEVVAPPDQNTTLVTSHKQIVEALVKHHGLHEGTWGLFVRFGIAASNVGPDDNQLQPAAIIPVLEIGLQRFLKETNLSVDAAKVNPKQENK